MAHALDELIADGVEGRHVLVRSDLNVPLDGTTVTDDGRIKASLPVLKKLSEAGARVIVMAHLGRPKGQVDPQYSLAPAAARLAELADFRVATAHDVVGDDARAKAEEQKNGDILVIENVRFDPRETSKDDAERATFADELVSLAGENGAYVDDAFGAVHRKHASVYDVAKKLPAYMGDLVKTELDVLSTLIENPDRPFVVVMGGSKVSDKLAVIDNLIGKADALLIGGGMGYTFAAAQGYNVGKSLLEKDQIENVKKYLERGSAEGTEFVLATDVVWASAFAADAQNEIRPIESLEEGEIGPEGLGLDIGPETQKVFAEYIKKARTVFWNGPVGVFEMEAFAGGTKTVAQALADSDAMSVIGGGDSASAVRNLGFKDEDFGHISTGGGASLEFIEGKELPGLEALGA
ncbi:phosphoglycerate kinase [Kocuria sp. TGY1127_2]|uniref:phosphoglycerate kinase n=1 Tax=Kocuria sp. TGY1127_2 TaxID=2711328 RepID=UPI0015C13143|nr:phosphoglycerate kinase [Kocuria sp. TGY1127_2]